MSRLTICALIIAYCMAGTFLAGIFDDYGNGPSPLVMLLWPALLLLYVLFGFIDCVYTVGKKLGNIIFGR